MKTLSLTILSPARQLYRGDVSTVTLPGIDGEFSILYQHAPLIAQLKAGNIVFKPVGSNQVETLSITGGFAEVVNNSVSVCVS
jgi:F-type H+-transporting ATPase subunit epsilon